MTNQDYTVILADGDFPSSPRAVDALRNAKRIVCCDGAAIHLTEFGLEPAAVVGDIDTLAPEHHERFASCLIHETEQDTNDLSKAFRYCIRQGWKNLLILGATGKREDHTLGNISLLSDFVKIADEIHMLTDYGLFTAVDRTSEFASFPGEQVSIFALDPETEITSHNLKYTMTGFHPSRWWQATLNESLGNSFRLEIQSGTILVYQAYGVAPKGNQNQASVMP